MSAGRGVCTLLGMEQKIVVLHGFTADEAVALMKTVKEAVAGASDAAFATTTETNLQWKLSYLVEHVSEEHKLFKEMRAKGSKKQGG